MHVNLYIDTEDAICSQQLAFPKFTSPVPSISQRHILWGDEKALKEVLPSGLRLIQRARQLPCFVAPKLKAEPSQQILRSYRRQTD